MTFATNPENEIEIETLAKALAELGPEGMLSYRQMSDLVGFDIQHNRRYILVRAREKVEEETGLRFETVIGEGVRPLGKEELRGMGMSARRRIGRISKRVVARLTNLKGYNDIDSRDQAGLDAERSLHGAIREIASTQNNHIASLTKRGPIVVAAVFDYIRPQRAKPSEAD